MSLLDQPTTSQNSKNTLLDLFMQPKKHYCPKLNDHNKKKNIPRRMPKWNGYYGTRVEKSSTATLAQ